VKPLLGQLFSVHGKPAILAIPFDKLLVNYGVPFFLGDNNSMLLCLGDTLTLFGYNVFDAL